MMNSSLARPTPEFGMKENSKADSGSPTFIMILVLGVRKSLRLTEVTEYLIFPSYTFPTSPSAQETVTTSPVLIFRVAGRQPPTAGMPISRDTIAAWDVRPPELVTIDDAIFMIGSQSGSVISVTKTSH